MQKSNRIIRVCVAAALAGGTSAAVAAGFALTEQNASGLGNAYSGQAAAAENASTVWFNPAGMTRLQGTQVSGSVSAIRPSAVLGVDPTRSALPLGGAFTNGGDAGGSWKYLPTAYVSYQFNPNWWFGLGVTSPFGLSTEYDAFFVGRFQSRKAEIKTYDINPSIAYKVNNWLALGGGLSYQHATIKVLRSANLGAEGFSNLTTSDSQFGYNLGAMINPTPNTRIGLTYRSSLSYALTGTVQVTTAAGAVVATPSILMNARTPDSWSVAFAHTPYDRWEVLGDFTWTNWSTVKDIPVTATSASALGAVGAGLSVFNFQFKDSYRLGVGANYKWTDSFMLKLGIAHDKSPAGDNRLVTLPDNDRTWLAIGGKYRVSQAGTLDFGYAHLFIKNATISQLGGVGGPPASGNVVGTYKDKVDIVSVQYTHSF